MARTSNTVARVICISTFVFSTFWIIACSSDAAGPAQNGTPNDTVATVFMPGNSFSPFTTTIVVGKSVIFDFPAEAHNVIFEKRAGVPADIQVTANRKVSRTFNSAGTFPYDCTLHPGMSGQIVVR